MGESSRMAVPGPEGAGATRPHRRSPIPIQDLRGEDHAPFRAGLWSRLDQTAGPDACWPWQGSRFKNGYGIAYVAGRRCGAHRVAYAAAHGAVPAGAKVLHSCDNPPCGNPRHLHLGDQQKNLAEMASRERGTHRFDAAAVDEMRRLRAAGFPVVAIADMFGTTKQRVCLLLSGRRGTRRYTPTTEPPIPPHPRLAEQINVDLAMALIGMGHSVGSVATWMGASPASLRSYARRSRVLRRPVPIDAASLAVLLDIQAATAPALRLPHLFAGVTGPLPSLTLARPGVAQAVGGLLHHRRTRLTPAQTAELCTRHQAGEPLGSLSEAFGICREHASRLARAVLRADVSGSAGTRP